MRHFALHGEWNGSTSRRAMWHWVVHSHMISGSAQPGPYNEGGGGEGGTGGCGVQRPHVSLQDLRLLALPTTLIRLRARSADTCLTCGTKHGVSRN